MSDLDVVVPDMLTILYKRDSEYIIIKQWVPEHEQDVLFEHSRRLREGRLLTNTTTELKKERDKLLLVKKKEKRKSSPGRAWIFT